MRANTPTFRAAAVAAALSVLLAACGDDGRGTDPSTTEPSPTTTAPVTTTPPPTTTIPPTTTTTQAPSTTEPGTVVPSEEAQATLGQIEALAEAGDLQGLAELALTGEVLFTASFGQEFSDPAELAAFWAEIEEPSIPGVILGLLDAGYHQTFATYPDGTQVPIFVTPAVMGEDSTVEDRERLESIFGTETVTRWFGDGMYLGWRMGVDADGNWRFLVIGD